MSGLDRRIGCVGVVACAFAPAQEVVFPEGRDRVTMPIVLEENGHLPVAAVFVEVGFGDERAPMLIDTGAGMHLVTSRLVERLELKAGNESFAIGMSDAQRMRRYHLPVLDVGGVTIEGAMAVGIGNVLRAFEKTWGVRVGGALGTGLFGQGPVTFDFVRERLTLRSSEASWEPPPGAIELPLTSQMGTPIVRASICGGRALRFLVDTGNDSTIIVHGPYAKRRGFLNRKDELAPAGIGGAFGKSEGYLGLLPSVELGELRFSDVPALIVEPGGSGITGGGLVVGNIGMGFWSRFARVTFDYRGRRLVVEPRPGVDPLAARDGFGMKLRKRLGKVVVQGVLGGSPADEAGLRRLDVVRSIDGEPCPDSVTATVRRLRAKRAVVVGMGRHDADDYEVELEARALFRPVAVEEGRR
jgi:predicted aspartyl protease